LTDGDLSDWPKDLPRYPITFRFLGEAPADPRDCSAEFCVGYNEVENALYFAIDIQDEERPAVSRFPVARHTTERTLVSIAIDTDSGGHVKLGCQHGESVSKTVLEQGDFNFIYLDPTDFLAALQRPTRKAA
jgi:hypothetical protein